jgi:hypothetical protein
MKKGRAKPPKAPPKNGRPVRGARGKVKTKAKCEVPNPFLDKGLRNRAKLVAVRLLDPSTSKKLAQSRVRKRTKASFEAWWSMLKKKGWSKAR